MLQKRWLSIVLIFSFLLLFLCELTLLFLVGPVSLTQEMKGTADFAHWLDNIIWFIRALLIGVVFALGVPLFKNWKKSGKILFVLALILYGLIFYGANFSFNAASLFQDQTSSIYLDSKENTVPLDKVVLGVTINSESKAYPIEYLAYHHKVKDEVGGQGILPTYCIYCRSGRVFKSAIDGADANFSLVGMLGYNAVIEDESSGTWWQQATGEAIAGEKKGQELEEVFSEQMPLLQWVEKYPNTLILQPDTLFNEAYEHSSQFVYRYGEMDRGMEYESWKKRSWVIGVEHEGDSKAFDFNTLIEEHIIHDSVGDQPVVVFLERDTINFHVWNPIIDTLNLTFAYDKDLGMMMDKQTLSRWKTNGECIEGPLIGNRLQTIPAYEEYWYSWKAFHPNTKQHGNLEEDAASSNQ